ncbi:MAG: hypothetical protein AB7I38_11935 [Dehalococcoidia bacterium]
MPTVPEYRLLPGHPIEVEIRQPDGARAIAVGVLHSVPESHTGGVARRLVGGDARVQALPATKQ